MMLAMKVVGFRNYGNYEINSNATQSEKIVKPTDTLDFVRCLHASSVTAIPLG
jgi:hypothetical protein